jgi:hypothetical protein
MGSICSQEEQEINNNELLKSATLDFDKQNDILDQLTHERYKAACKIQSLSKGYLVRKRINALVNLMNKKNNYNKSEQNKK